MAVSLTHEQALVEYDPAVVRPAELAETLRATGYPPSDPRKVRPYEEEERALVREGKRLLVAIAASLIAAAETFDPSGWVGIAVPVVVGGSLMALAFLILRADGLWRAVGGAVGLGGLTTALLVVRGAGLLHAAVPWLVAAVAVLPDRGVLRRRGAGRQLSPVLRVAVAAGQDAQLAGGQAAAGAAA